MRWVLEAAVGTGRQAAGPVSAAPAPPTALTLLPPSGLHPPTRMQLAVRKAGQLLKPLRVKRRALALLTDGRIDSHQVGAGGAGQRAASVRTCCRSTPVAGAQAWSVPGQGAQPPDTRAAPSYRLLRRRGRRGTWRRAWR